MESVVHLLITLRGPVWRVRILIPGESRPRWRAYRAEDYPTPEAVARRCAEGLTRRGENEDHDDSDADGDQKISQHGGTLRVQWACWGRLEATNRA